MTSILELLRAVVKELVEAIPTIISANDLASMADARECFTVVFTMLPSILNQEYLNPILVLPDILSVCLDNGDEA